MKPVLLVGPLLFGLSGCIALLDRKFDEPHWVPSGTRRGDVRLRYSAVADLGELLVCPVLFPLSVLGGVLTHAGLDEAAGLLLAAFPGNNASWFAREEPLAPRERQELEQARELERALQQERARWAAERAASERQRPRGWWAGRR